MQVVAVGFYFVGEVKPYWRTELPVIPRVGEYIRTDSADTIYRVLDVLYEFGSGGTTPPLALNSVRLVTTAGQKYHG